MKPSLRHCRGLYGPAGWLVALAAGALMPGISNVCTAKPYAYVSNVVSGTLSVIDVSQNRVVKTINVQPLPDAVAAAPDGTRVYATAYDDNAISVIDTAQNTMIATVPVGTGPTGVAVTPDSGRVYVANGAGNTVSVVDTASLAVIATVPVGVRPLGGAVTLDGKSVYVANFYSNSISIISTLTNTAGPTVAVGVGPIGLAVNPDGKHAYVTNSGDGTMSVIETTGNSVTATVEGLSSPFGVAVSPDGREVYVTNRPNFSLGWVSVIETDRYTIAATIPVLDSPEGIALTPDGRQVYAVNGIGQGPGEQFGSVSIIDTVTRTVEANVLVGKSPLSLGQFIADVPIGCTSTADLRSGGSSDLVRITNQAKEEMPYTVQFINAQGTVQGRPIAKLLTPNQSASNTVGSLMQQAGIRTFNPANLLQVRTEPKIGVTESWLQSVLTPTNGTPPVMMVYTCEPEVPPK